MKSSDISTVARLIERRTALARFLSAPDQTGKKASSRGTMSISVLPVDSLGPARPQTIRADIFTATDVILTDAILEALKASAQDELNEVETMLKGLGVKLDEVPE